MFQKLVSHNKDIKLLVEQGYAVGFDSNYMVIRDIPYLDADKQLQIGAIVTKLEFVDQERVTQQNHQVSFAGSSPCSIDGKTIPNLGDSPHQLVLSEKCNDIIVQRIFSNKPKSTGIFADFFEKINSYVAIISGPAMEMYDVSPYTFKIVENVESGSVFKIHDTLTSLAEITDLSANLKNDVIALIGLGGTGAYILDFLVKTPVREIKAFDFDLFHIHNAFRSPGMLDKDELSKRKAEVYHSRYANFRDGLTIETKFIDTSCGEDLNGVTFAFVCVDKGSSRSEIFDLLLSKKIPFIDVGMGLHRKRGPISGQLRTTYYSSEQGQNIRARNLAPLTDSPDDIYKTNIQIGELNALNACLAVMRFKQLRGFYFEESPWYHLLFEVGGTKIVSESDNNED
jgi:hypothetical protein